MGTRNVTTKNSSEYKYKNETRDSRNGLRDNGSSAMRQEPSKLYFKKNSSMIAQTPISRASSTSSKSAKVSIEMDYSTSSSSTGITSDNIRDIVHHIASGHKLQISSDTNSHRVQRQAHRGKIIDKNAFIQHAPAMEKSPNRSLIGLHVVSDGSMYISSSSMSSSGVDRNIVDKKIGKYPVNSTSCDNHGSNLPSKGFVTSESTTAVGNETNGLKLLDGNKVAVEEMVEGLANDNNPFMPKNESSDRAMKECCRHAPQNVCKQIISDDSKIIGNNDNAERLDDVKSTIDTQNVRNQNISDDSKIIVSNYNAARLDVANNTLEPTENKRKQNFADDLTVTVNNCNNSARNDHAQPTVNPIEKNAVPIMPPIIDNDMANVEIASLMTCGSKDSNQAIYQDIIAPTISSVTVGEFSPRRYYSDSNYKVPVNHFHAIAENTDYAYNWNHHQSPSLISPSCTLNRPMQNCALPVSVNPRPMLSDPYKFSRYVSQWENAGQLHPIPFTSYTGTCPTIDQHGHDLITKMKYGSSFQRPTRDISCRPTLQSTWNTHSSPLRDNVCPSTRLQMMHNDHILEQRNQTHHSPINHVNPQYETNHITYNDLGNAYYPLSRNQLTGSNFLHDSTCRPLDRSTHPYEINSLANLTISHPQSQSCIPNGYCSYTCKCPYCRVHLSNIERSSIKINATDYNLRPQVIPPDFHNQDSGGMTSTVAASVSDAFPIHDMHLYRKQNLEKQLLSFSHRPFTASSATNIQQARSRFGDELIDVHKHEVISNRSRNDTIQQLSDNVTKMRLSRDYHDRLKSRKIQNLTRETTTCASKNDTIFDEERSQSQLYQSEEKIHALERILDLRKAQHEFLLEAKNKRQIGR